MKAEIWSRINGLAVYGPNSGALLEIEVTVMPSA